jgi:Predicted Zn-dependent protease (DUF2268)
MAVRFVPLDAGREFAPGRMDAIVSWLENAARDSAPPLAIEHIDVVIVPGKRLIPGWDCNGYTHGPWRITLTVDPDCDGREQRPLDAQMRAVLAHELHHAKREREPGYGSSLGEALVSEGLAQCYEEQVGCPTPSYALAVRGPVLAKLARLARTELDSTSYDHSKWFFGSKTDTTFPLSGGYSLGYVLVRRWLDDAGMSASTAATVIAREVLPEAFDLAAVELGDAEFASARDRESGDQPTRTASLLRRLLRWQ